MFECFGVCVVMDEFNVSVSGLKSLGINIGYIDPTIEIMHSIAIRFVFD